jgi:hypothetical protein
MRQTESRRSRDVGSGVGAGAAGDGAAVSGGVSAGSAFAHQAHADIKNAKIATRDPRMRSSIAKAVAPMSRAKRGEIRGRRVGWQAIRISRRLAVIIPGYELP